MMERIMDRYLGVGLMISSALLFSLMNYSVKIATATIPGSEVAFVRFSFGLAMVGLMATGSKALHGLGWKGGGVRLTWRKLPLIIARGILGGVAILLLYIALASGNLTNVTALNYSYAVFATIFGVLLLGERPGWRAYMALTASIAGVLLMVGGVTGMGPGDIPALISSVVSGLAIVVVRELRRTESTWSIFSSLCFFGSVVAALYGWRTFIMPHGASLWWVLAASVTGFVAQISMTTGFKYCTATVGSIISISSVPVSGILGYFLLGDRLTVTESAGALLIISGCVVVAITEGRRATEVRTLQSI